MTREKLLKAIRSAFDAGCARGHDEAVAYEWGSFSGQTDDEAFTDFMEEWNSASEPLRAVLKSGACD